LRDGFVYSTDVKKLSFYYSSNELWDNVNRTCHGNLGHVGIDKTLSLVNNSYWFSKMRNIIKHNVSKCLKCLSYAPKNGKAEELLLAILKDNLPI